MDQSQLMAAYPNEITLCNSNQMQFNNYSSAERSIPLERTTVHGITQPIGYRTQALDYEGVPWDNSPEMFSPDRFSQSIPKNFGFGFGDDTEVKPLSNSMDEAFQTGPDLQNLQLDDDAFDYTRSPDLYRFGAVPQDVRRQTIPYGEQKMAYSMPRSIPAHEYCPSPDFTTSDQSACQPMFHMDFCEPEPFQSSLPMTETFGKEHPGKVYLDSVPENSAVKQDEEETKMSILDDIASIIERDSGEMAVDTVPQTGPFAEYMTPTDICHPRKIFAVKQEAVSNEPCLSSSIGYDGPYMMHTGSLPTSFSPPAMFEDVKPHISPANLPVKVIEYDEFSSGGNNTPPPPRKRHASWSKDHRPHQHHVPRIRRDSDRSHRIVHQRVDGKVKDEGRVVPGRGSEDTYSPRDDLSDHRRRKTFSCSSGKADDSDDDDDEDDEDYKSDSQDEAMGDAEGDSRAAGEKDTPYFWQYNSHSKGPRGRRFDIKLDKAGDPQQPAHFVDPVFDPDQSTKVKHIGRQRKGDGTDITPNPKKLYNIGQELERLANRMGEVPVGSPGSDLPLQTSRREKNKLASRACRLKKKAQHEADKIKLDGLEKERSALIEVIKAIRPTLEQRRSSHQQGGHDTSLVGLLNELENKHLKSSPRVAGRMTSFVKDVMDQMKEIHGASQQQYDSSDEN